MTNEFDSWAEEHSSKFTMASWFILHTLLLTIIGILLLFVIHYSFAQENGTEGIVGPSGPNVLNGEYYLESKWDENMNLVQEPPRPLDDFTPEELEDTFHLKNGSKYYDEDGKLDKQLFMEEAYSGNRIGVESQ